MPSPLESMTIADVIEAFEFLETPQERMEYVIDLAKKLPPFPETEKKEVNMVHGCQSQVWMVMRQDAETKRLQLDGDSDSILVKGLVALVILLFSNKTAEEVLKTSAEETFQKLNLDSQLSPNRRTGLRGMVERIKTLAKGT